MYKKVKVLDPKKDTNLKVGEVKGFRYANDITQSIITIDEFFTASKSYPIVFGKNQEGEFFATVIMGFETNNLFIDSRGAWKKGEYIPAYVRRYPFVFVQNDDRLFLAVDEDCKEVNEKKGEALFEKNGELTKYSDKVMEFMKNFQISYLKTLSFIKELDELGLLEDTNANIAIDGKKFAFTGFKRVNEDRLNNLNDSDLLKLVRSGTYKLIIAHLISISNFDKLATFYK